MTTTTNETTMTVRDELIACELPTTVHAYFALKFARDPRDATLRDLPVDSPCGEDCCEAITSAARLASCAEIAFGDASPEVRKCAELAEEIIVMFWRG